MDRWLLYPGNEKSRVLDVTNADLLSRLTPRAKFVIILRNPVDRYVGTLVKTSTSTSVINTEGD